MHLQAHGIPGSVYALAADLTQLSWVVCITNVGAERRAAVSIDRVGLVAYLPTEIRSVVRRYKRSMTVAPLLPRYCFVGFDPDVQGVHQLRSLNGVEGIVRFDGYVVFVPAPVVEELATRELLGEFNASKAAIKREPRFCVGQSVQATSGPFEGRKGSVVQAFRSGNVDVLLSFFGRQVRTSFPEVALREAS
jgi:transcriptional antiterminator RfaH